MAKRLHEPMLPLTGPVWRAVALSVALHGAVLGTVVWRYGWSVTPAQTNFAAGEQDLVVQLRLVERDDGDGPKLRWTAIPQDEATQVKPLDTPPIPKPIDTRSAYAVAEPIVALADATLPVAEPDQMDWPDPPATRAVEPARPAEPAESGEPSDPPPPAEPAPAPAEKGVQSQAEAIDLPTPNYPVMSKRRGEVGTVLLEAVVAADGSVIAVNVIKSPGHERLVKAATEALRKAKFRPAMRGNMPAESRVRVPFVFAIKR